MVVTQIVHKASSYEKSRPSGSVSKRDLLMNVLAQFVDALPGEEYNVIWF